jgi:hypothetical protein
MYDVSESGELKDKTGLDSWARIARVIHQAQCLSEKKNKEAEAQRTAAELGKSIDQVALAKALEGIELKYNGGKTANGKKINPDKSPAISGLQQKMTTQVLVVKMLPDDKTPDWKSAQYAVLELSNAKMVELIAIEDNSDYFHDDKTYLEVGYNYIGTDKKSAGQSASFQGIANSLSLEESDPLGWASSGKALVDGLVVGKTIEDTAELIKSRNRNLKSSHTPAEVVTAFKKWCSTNDSIFGSINYEDDATKRASKDFLDSHLLDTIPVVKKRFEELLAEKEAEEGKSNGEEAAETSTPAADTPVEPTFEETEQKNLQQAAAIIDAGAAGQTLAQLAQAVPDVTLTSSDDEVDMGDL